MSRFLETRYVNYLQCINVIMTVIVMARYVFAFLQRADHISSNVHRVSACRHTTGVMVAVTATTAATNTTAVSFRLICVMHLLM